MQIPGCASPAAGSVRQTNIKNRCVLLIAFQFPPFHGSSAVQRTLRFAQHLAKFGWRPIVLTVHPGAYEAVATGKGNEIPAVEVHRAFGFDTARVFRVIGRYPRALALPDRWASWRYWAVGAALRIIRRQKVDALWSTFPIATAHQIALTVARRSGLPWMAEFRDPMWQGDYPPDPAMNRAWKQLEAQIFARAAAVAVTTPGAAELYAARFPAFDPRAIHLIENGYDEETFQRAAAVPDTAPPGARALKLLHSGVVYRSERDPTQLFAAVQMLKQSNRLSAGELQIVFRATGDDAGYLRDVQRLGIEDIVRIEPPIDYLGALQEMLSADGLLILQASNCNAQIPAKLYEYLRARRPILALTDPAGDTARTLSHAGVGTIARLDSREAIAAALLEVVATIKEQSWTCASAAVIQSYSREAQTGQLARVLDGLLDRPGARAVGG